jgi:hypothetical protein
MLSINLNNFGGILPKIGPKLLPPNSAQIAQNVDLGSGRLVPNLALATVAGETLTASAIRAYLWRYKDSSDTEQTKWLNWATDVDVVQSPVALDAYSRIYYTGDGAPKVKGTNELTLDVDTIVWQSGTTVRYTFNGSPDLSAVLEGYIVVTAAANASNNGSFLISTISDGSDYIEVTIAARTDGTDDEASDCPASVAVMEEKTYALEIPAPNTAATVASAQEFSFGGVQIQIVRESDGTIVYGPVVVDAQDVNEVYLERQWQFQHESTFTPTTDVRYLAQVAMEVTPFAIVLVCGTAGITVAATWAAITDGEFTVSVGGTSHDITAIDFTGDTTMDEVAATIQARVRAVTGASETAVYSTDHFVVTAGDTITYLSAVSGGTGTDISGTGHLNGRTGGTAYLSTTSYLWAQNDGNDSHTHEVEFTANGNLVKLFQQTAWSIDDSGYAVIDVTLMRDDHFIANPIASYLYYVYTFITSWGEEGPPSPLSEIFIREVGYDAALSNLDIPISVSGTLAPDVTGDWFYDGAYNSASSWVHEDGAYYLWWDNSTKWIISTAKGTNGAAYWERTDADHIGAYTAAGTATGTGTSVASNSRGITQRRIYRTVAGGEKDSFRFLDDIENITSTTYSDTSSDAAAGEELQTEELPANFDSLSGLRVAAGSFLVAFYRRSVYCTEPNLPFAWRSNYTQTLDADIIGLEVSANDIVVLTDRTPVLLTGSHPRRLTQTVIMMNQPCVSKASITRDRYSVLYASPDGLVQLSGANGDVITGNLLSRAQWQAIRPEEISAQVHDGRYYAFKNLQVNPNAAAATDEGGGLVGLPVTAHGYDDGDLITVAGTTNYDGQYFLNSATSTDKLVIKATYVAETFGGTETITSTPLIIDLRAGAQMAITTADEYAAGAVLDIENDLLHIIQGTALKTWAGATTDKQGLWRSKDYEFPRPVEFSAAKVVASSYTSGANAIKLRLYSDGALKVTRSITSEIAIRLPQVTPQRTWAVEVETYDEIDQVIVGTSMAALRQA